MTSAIKWMGIRKPLPEDNLVLMSTDGGEIWASLPLYLDEVNHSPTGFEWGYGGSGPAQLSYAILRTFEEITLGISPEWAKGYAQIYHQQFKWDIVCNRFGRSDSWELTSEEVGSWLRDEMKRRDKEV